MGVWLQCVEDEVQYCVVVGGFEVMILFNVGVFVDDPVFEWGEVGRYGCWYVVGEVVFEVVVGECCAGCGRVGCDQLFD